jgi:hypothetical protein
VDTICTERPEVQVEADDGAGTCHSHSCSSLLLLLSASYCSAASKWNLTK